MISVQVSAYVKRSPRWTAPKLRYQRYHNLVRVKLDVPLTEKQLHVTIRSPNLAWKSPAMQEFE